MNESWLISLLDNPTGTGNLQRPIYLVSFVPVEDPCGPNPISWCHCLWSRWRKCPPAPPVIRSHRSAAVRSCVWARCCPESLQSHRTAATAGTTQWKGCLSKKHHAEVNAVDGSVETHLNVMILGASYHQILIVPRLIHSQTHHWAEVTR